MKYDFIKTTLQSKLQYIPERLDAYLLDYSEEGLHRYSAKEEEDQFKYVEMGDMDGLIQRFQDVDMANEIETRVGKMADSPKKSLEYMACISIALTSRAAVRGGVDINIAYTLTDIFLRYLEKCTTIEEIIILQKDAMLIFTDMVKQTQEKRGSYAYIENAKNYIARHLNKKFTLQDLADELGLNANYLSRRFSVEEGIGIKEYTLKKRIEASKNMLRFSDLPIQEIATYLCFPSQSYFGSVFKKQCGMTPQAFRNWSKQS